MSFLSKVYTVSIYKDGGFCWKVTAKDRTIEQIKRDSVVVAISVIIVSAVILLKYL